MSVANDIFPHPQGGSGGRVKTLPYRCFETRAGSLGRSPCARFLKMDFREDFSRQTQEERDWEQTVGAVSKDTGVSPIIRQRKSLESSRRFVSGFFVGEGLDPPAEFQRNSDTRLGKTEPFQGFFAKIPAGGSRPSPTSGVQKRTLPREPDMHVLFYSPYDLERAASRDGTHHMQDSDMSGYFQTMEGRAPVPAGRT